MTTKDRKDVYERTTERVIEALENGVVLWQRPWRLGVSGEGFGTMMPCNANSKRVYRGWNLVATLFSGYGSPYWATFKGWKRLGGSVRKGEKGTLVVGWKAIEREEDKEEDGVIKRVTRRHLVGFGYTVFNEEQVEGATVPQRRAKVELDPSEPIDDAQAVLDEWVEREDGCPIAHGGDRAFYSAMLDRIGLPAFGAFESPEAYYKTAFHEMTHATGHEKRLNRPELMSTAGQASEPYAKEELTAELGAAFMMAMLGLNAVTEDNTAGYIDGWLGALRNDKKLLISAASKAQAAVDFVLGAATEPAQAPDEEAVAA